MGKKWKDPLVWFRGLVAAFIGGGAGAVVAGVIVTGQTPEKYNFGSGLHNLVVMVLATFIANGILMAFAYLQKSPLPELEETETTVTVKQTTTIETK